MKDYYLKIFEAQKESMRQNDTDISRENIAEITK